ncbi:MAG: GNAT family N-acetyltransferase [Acidimicrobiales bacterium]
MTSATGEGPAAGGPLGPADIGPLGPPDIGPLGPPDIGPLGPADIGELLPLIADYQRFYGVERPDNERNLVFFSRLLGPSEAGCFLGARLGGRLVGYACLYFTMSSVEAEDVVLLNDLFVVSDTRGTGTGRLLIEAAVAVTRQRGLARLRWATALDNRRAQRLYEQMGAERSVWFEYEIGVD